MTGVQGMTMKGDEMARQFDQLFADFLEAARARAALGLPLPKGAGKNGETGTLAPWFASKEGRSRVKQTMAAMKAERRALKALAKFGRKMIDAKAEKVPEPVPNQPTVEPPSPPSSRTASPSVAAKPARGRSKRNPVGRGRVNASSSARQGHSRGTR
ncbi:hypothetical protein [Alsobacter sp. R-9]